MSVRINSRRAGMLFVVLTLGAAMAIAHAQQALREGDGVWVKGPVSGTSPACMQVWNCNPTEPVGVTDEETLSFTASQSTSGRCFKFQANDACRVCDAPPPAEACKWQVFEKP